MADLEQLRREYIRTDKSYRILAEEYGVSRSSLSRTGAREGWPQQRRKYRQPEADPPDTPPQRLRDLIGRTMDLMEEILRDELQFNRHLVKVKSEGDAEQGERIYRKVDTKALMEFVAGLKELKSMIQEEAAPQTGIHVVFEAGEEEFNE